MILHVQYAQKLQCSEFQYQGNNKSTSLMSKGRQKKHTTNDHVSTLSPSKANWGAAQRYRMGKPPLEKAEGSLGTFYKQKRTPGNRIILRRKRPGDFSPFYMLGVSLSISLQDGSFLSGLIV